MRKCLKCGTINPDDAERCDCGMELQSVQDLPWSDVPPWAPWKRSLGLVAFLLTYLFFVEAVAGAILTPMLVGLSEDGSPLQQLLASMLALLVFVPAAIALFRLQRRLRARVFHSLLAKRCEGSQLLFIGGSFWRSLRGPGAIDFEQRSLKLSGRSGADLLVVLMIAVPVACLHVAAGGGPPGALMLGGIAVASWYAWHSSGKVEAEVNTDSLGGIRFESPIVEMYLRTAPIRGLRRLRFYLCPSFRREFFQGFAKVFPATLPPEYQRALDGLDSSPSAGEVHPVP